MLGANGNGRTWHRAWSGRLWLCVVGLVALGCSPATDEERLKEEVDATPAHLFVALKKAVAADPGDPAVQQAREFLDAVLRPINDWASQPAAAQGAATSPPRSVSVAETLALGKALLALRGIGAEELRKWRGSTLSVLAGRESLNDDSLGLPSEHAMLLMLLTASTLDHKAPVPVPRAALLYEAYMMGEEPLPEAEFEPIARALQAYVYASGELCDLAQSATTALAAHAPTPGGAQLQTLTLGLLGVGRVAAHAPEAGRAVVIVLLLENLPWISRLLAHSATARCLEQRDEPERALREWQRALDVAESVGIPAEELALFRAYVAYKAGRMDEVRGQLTQAKQSQLLDDPAKRELDLLLEHFDPAQRSALDDFFEPVLLTGHVGGIIHRRLNQQGVYDELARLPALLQLRAVMRALQPPPLPKPAGLWNRVLAWWAD